MAADSKVVCDLVESLLSQPSILEAISQTLDVPRNPQTHVQSNQTLSGSSNANNNSLSISRSNYNTRYRNRGQDVAEEVRHVFSRGRCSSVPMESAKSGQEQSETQVPSTMAQAPIFRFTRNFGRQNAERTHQPNYTRRHFRGPPTFTKEVILLSGPHDEIVVKQGTKQFLYESGHIITTFEFNKLWTNLEVQDHLHMAFSPKIDNIDIKLLMPCHNKLVQPLLMDKQSLSGLIISKLFKQKSVYLQPSKQILELPELQGPEKGIEEKSDLLMWLESETTFSSNSAEPEYPVKEDSSDPLNVSNYTATAVSANTARESTLQISSSHSVLSEGFDDHYRCYTELLIDNVQIPDEEESDDSIINIAERNEVHESESNGITLRDLLSNLALQIDSEKTSKFNINRRNIWDGARRAFLRKTYKATNRISVMFTDSSGNSEGAVDLGGPTREFLRLLMHYLQHSKLFEGPENRKTLSCDAQGMRNDEYYLAGQAMAVSLVHGGPAPNFVSPVLYQCLVSDAKHVHSSLGDVVDPETLDMLQEIENASSLENLQGLIQKHSTVLSIAGCFRPLKSLNDKRELLEDFINWYIVGRTVPSLVRLKEGLKTLGVLQAMEIHKHIFEEAFVWMEQEITTDTINGMFNIKFSPSGSNYRIQEEHIIGYWRDYLQDCEEQSLCTAEVAVTSSPKSLRLLYWHASIIWKRSSVFEVAENVSDSGLATWTTHAYYMLNSELACQAKIKDILCFVTGANTVPPLGFDPQPSIEFLHACSGQVQLSMFPEANTCGNVLRLPLSMSYEEFKTNMDFGILNSPGFGRA